MLQSVVRYKFFTLQAPEMLQYVSQLYVQVQP